MMLYSFLTNPQEFDDKKSNNDSENPFDWHIPKNTAPIDVVCSALLFEIEVADETDQVVYDKDKLVSALKQHIQDLDWFKCKTLKEQKKVFEYIEEYEPLNPLIDY